MHVNTFVNNNIPVPGPNTQAQLFAYYYQFYDTALPSQKTTSGMLLYI